MADETYAADQVGDVGAPLGLAPMSGPTGSPAVTKAFAMLALLTSVLYLALLGLMYFDWQALTTI